MVLDFNVDDKVMKSVILPCTCNVNELDPGLKYPYNGAGWYKKQFEASKPEGGHRLRIEWFHVFMISQRADCESEMYNHAPFYP